MDATALALHFIYLAIMAVIIYFFNILRRDHFHMETTLKRRIDGLQNNIAPLVKLAQSTNTEMDSSSGDDADESEEEPPMEWKPVIEAFNLKEVKNE